MLGLCGLLGSNLLESSLCESMKMGVTVLVSSRLSIGVSEVLVPLSMISSSLSRLSGFWWVLDVAFLAAIGASAAVLDCSFVVVFWLQSS